MSRSRHLPPSTPAGALANPVVSAPFEELLKQAGTGDQGAFAEVYDATASRAFGLALSVTGDRSLAENVVQEAFSDIWRTAASFDPASGSGSAWVISIVHRKAVDSLRATSTRLNAEKDAPETPAAAGHDLATPQGQKVRLALSQVPAAQREAVELAYFGGYTHTAIARMTGMPVESAKSRIREGLIEFRRGMQSAS